MSWIIYDHHLAYETEKEVLHPSAEEIFSCVYSGADINNLPSPIEELDEICFSKIGSPLKCEICFEGDNCLRLNLYAIRKNNKYQVDIVNGHIIDHGLTESEWFYINSDVESLQDKLENARIQSCGEINIEQYIDLIRQDLLSNNKEIENNVTPEIIKEMMIPVGETPKGITASLYDYQKTGFLWIKNMLQSTRGCILGDEMGLGKTLQVITVLQFLKDCGELPCLVVAPVSLLENWKRECKKFAPSLDVYIHHGSTRTGWASVLQKHDISVISYNTAVSDLSLLNMIDWRCVVLDEAHYIKNPYSNRSRSVKEIRRSGAIAVTGTPFENHITDIWSIVDFCIPNLLGSLTAFQKHLSDDVEGAKKIEPVLSSLMIRRLVTDVAKDLPEKIIISQPIAMSEQEQNEYEKIRQDAQNALDGGAPISIALLQKLRMYCTHPFLVDDSKITNPFVASIKYQRFCEILEDIISRNEKVIVFTSYIKMFDIIRNDVVNRLGIPVSEINGKTPVQERQKIVDWFNSYDGSALLALNPRAAGIGLNITGANHVIHYNLEWNPSLEDQATARAYRKGQKNNVFVYRLFYSNGVEEIVNDRIERKREMASVAVVGTEGGDDKADIIRALELTPVIN